MELEMCNDTHLSWVCIPMSRLNVFCQIALKNQTFEYEVTSYAQISNCSVHLLTLHMYVLLNHKVCSYIWTMMYYCVFSHPLRNLLANPLNCNCYMSWLPEWLKSRAIEAGNPTCREPNRLVERQIEELQREEFTCEGICHDWFELLKYIASYIKSIDYLL